LNIFNLQSSIFNLQYSIFNIQSSIFMPLPPVILASQSPRRRQLLEWAEVPHQIVVSDTDETYPAGLQPEEVAIHIAHQKALAVQQKLAGTRQDGQVIVAADTIVVLGEEIIGKPVDREDALNILRRLSGATHRVITGVVLLSDHRELRFADTTLVELYSLTDDQISFYVDKYQPFDKAGAYAIQEWIGVVAIKSINGDFYNVMGLPVSKVYSHLLEFL
jgi:septum formation protein